MTTPDELGLTPLEQARVPAVFDLRFHGSEPTATFEDRAHRCYELAGRAALNFAVGGWKTTVVHGTIGPYRNPHAWVTWRLEDGRRVVWDPVLDGSFLGSDYRTRMEAVEWTRYNAREVSRFMERHGDFGPWGSVNERRYDRLTKAMIESGVATGDEEVLAALAARSVS